MAPTVGTTPGPERAGDDVLGHVQDGIVCCTHQAQNFWEVNLERASYMRDSAFWVACQRIGRAINRRDVSLLNDPKGCVEDFSEKSGSSYE
jgi:hypothetical protein